MMPPPCTVPETEPRAEPTETMSKNEFSLPLTVSGVPSQQK